MLKNDIVAMARRIVDQYVLDPTLSLTETVRKEASQAGYSPEQGVRLAAFTNVGAQQRLFGAATGVDRSTSFDLADPHAIRQALGPPADASDFKVASHVQHDGMARTTKLAAVGVAPRDGLHEFMDYEQPLTPSRGHGHTQGAYTLDVPLGYAPAPSVDTPKKTASAHELGTALRGHAKAIREELGDKTWRFRDACDHVADMWRQGIEQQRKIAQALGRLEPVVRDTVIGEVAQRHRLQMGSQATKYASLLDTDHVPALDTARALLADCVRLRATLSQIESRIGS